MLKNKKRNTKKNIFNVFFFAFFVTSFCISCTPQKKYEGTLIIEKNEELQSFSQIMTLEELYFMLENKEDFILYVYGSDCLSCREYTPTIQQFVKDTHYQIYGIDVNYEDTRIYGRNNLIEYFETPTIAICDDGSYVQKVCPSLFSDIFESKETIYNYFKFYLDF